MNRQLFNLCGECYQISPIESWEGYNWDDEHEHIIPSGNDPTFWKCPSCGYAHIDDDSDPGVYEGSYEQMIHQVKELINDI